MDITGIVLMAVVAVVAAAYHGSRRVRRLVDYLDSLEGQDDAGREP